MTTIKETHDIEALMDMRMEVIDCVFDHPSTEDMEALADANRRFYRRSLADGSHIACLAYEDGALCGSGALCFYDEMPSPDNPSGRCAYIMNVYVRQAFRGQGIGRSIVAWLTEKGLEAGAGKIYLESTSTARSLYHNSGFRDMQNMMIYEDNDN